MLIPSWLPVVSGDKAAGDIPQCAKLTYRKYGKMEPIALTKVLRQVTRFQISRSSSQIRSNLRRQGTRFRTVPDKAWECFGRLPWRRGN